MIYSLLYTFPYLIVFFLLFFFSIPIIGGVKEKTLLVKQPAEYFVFAILVLFIAFRGFVLGDTLNYYDMYQTIPAFSASIDVLDVRNKNIILKLVEPGFIYYISIFKLFTDNFLVFQPVSSIIEMIVLYWFFKKYNKQNITLCFLFFILFYGINLSFMFARNIKAVLFFLVSLDFLIKRKILPYMVLNILGAMFHISSIVYLPLYFILNKRIDRKYILALFIIGNIIFLFRIRWFTQVLLLISPFLPEILGQTIVVYSSNVQTSGFYGLTFGYIERFFSFFLVYYFSNKLYDTNKNLVVFINSFFIYIMIYLFCAEFTMVVERIPILFVFSYWILFPKLYDLFNQRTKQLFLVLLVFYSIVKISVSFNIAPASYDNILFGYKSYNERRQELGYYWQIKGNR